MALIPGKPGPDILTGTPETNLILGFGGEDFISGQEGSDAIFAGPGDDTIAGDIVPIPGASPGPAWSLSARIRLPSAARRATT